MEEEESEETLEEIDAVLEQCTSRLHSIARAQHEPEVRQQRGRPLARVQAPLLGRVVRKGALCFWGGLQERAAQSFATKFSLELQDSSGRIQVTVWNRKCEALYRSVRVGDIALIWNYRLSRTSSAARSTDIVYEAMLNTRNPTGHLVVLSETKLGEHHAKHPEAPVVPVLTEEHLCTFEALEKRFASRSEFSTQSTLASGTDVEVAMPSDDELFDIVCAVVCAFPMTRHRSLPGRHPFSSFTRSRWLLVLVCATADADSKRLRLVPMCVAANHCQFRRGTGPEVDPDELFDAISPGRLYRFCCLRLCNARGHGNEEFFLCTTASSLVDGGPWNSIVGERTLGLWLEHKDEWRAHLRQDTQPLSMTVPSSMSSLFVEQPELRALCMAPSTHDSEGGATGMHIAANAQPHLCDPLLRRPLAALTEVVGIAAALHAREVRQFLVKAFLGQHEGRTAEEGIHVQVELKGINDVTARVHVTMVLRDDGAIGRGGALWRAISMAADGRRPAPRCSLRAVSRCLSKLADTPTLVVLALDLYQPPLSAPVVEVVALYSM